MNKKQIAIVGGAAEVKRVIADPAVSGTAIHITDDGHVSTVDIDAVRELHKTRQDDIRDLKRQLKPMPVEVLRSAGNRNKPCPCGSGLKFKKCCWLKEGAIMIEP